MSIYTPCSICLALALVHVRFQGDEVPKVTEALRAPFWHFWHPVGSVFEKPHALLNPTQLARFHLALQPDLLTVVRSGQAHAVRVHGRGRPSRCPGAEVDYAATDGRRVSLKHSPGPRVYALPRILV